MIPQETLDRLSKEWILTMAYGETAFTTDSLVEIGCKVMVHGHKSFDNIVKLVGELVNEKKIEAVGRGTYKITARGIFDVQNKTILPLLEIANNEKYREAFIIANREKCNIEFIENLVSHSRESDKINFIKIFSKKNYLDIAKVCVAALKFLDGHPEFDNTPNFDEL